MSIKSFEFYTPTEIRFGAGILSTLPDTIRELGLESVLLVSDPGVVEAGVMDRAASLMVW